MRSFESWGKKNKKIEKRAKRLHGTPTPCYEEQNFIVLKGMDDATRFSDVNNQQDESRYRSPDISQSDGVCGEVVSWRVWVMIRGWLY